MMKLTGTLFALADKNNKEENKRATSGGGGWQRYMDKDKQ